MILTNKALKVALVALGEGRLWWRVTDQYGRSCNGGDRAFRLDPSMPGQPGEWAPHIDDVQMCTVGYHVTCDPIRWSGLRVALVEVDEVVGRSNDKALCHAFREVGVVEPWDCFDARLWVAASRPMLDGASLDGARLDRARLVGARLDGASLDRARLDGASLDRASLVGARLVGARLDGASLDGARLDRASLDRASLVGARLVGARLDGARLDRARLDGASLDRARLDGASLDRARLGNWERGPDGYARRKKKS